MKSPPIFFERRRLAAALSGLGLVAASTSADAATRIFRLPSEPLPQALVRFAVQAGASVGGLPVAGCEGRSRPVQGSMPPAEALARLLPAGCRFEALDAASFKLLGAPAAPPARPSRVVQRQTDPLILPLVVTAERRPEPLLGTPFPASALSGATVQRLGGESFEDIASQFVGVTVTNLGSGRNKIFIRGLSDGSFTGKTQSTVGLYLNDLPITYDAPDPALRLVDVERVEVLRGPQGTLYGSGSIGGIVRIVTAKPDPASASAWVEADGAVTEHGAPSDGITAMLNLPLARDRAAVRVVGYDEELGGYIDNIRVARPNVNYTRRLGGRAALMAQVWDGWRLEGDYAHQTIHTAGGQYAQGAGGPLTRDTPVREPHDNDFTEVSVSAVHIGRSADFKVSAGYVEHGLATRYDATAAFPALPAALKAFDEDRRVRLAVLEANLASTAPGRVRWLAGMFAGRTQEGDLGSLDTFVAPVVTVYRRRDELSEAAIYGELTYDLTARIAVTGGLRGFASHTVMSARDFGLAGDPAISLREARSDIGLAPKVRVSYALSPDAVIYAQSQKGYRAGGFNLPSFARRMPGPISAPQGFAPDHLWSHEVGVAAPLFDQRLVLRYALFYAVWRGVQSDQYLANGLPLTVNIGDGRNAGMEVEAVWRPGEAFQARGALLLERPQLTRTTRLFPATPNRGLPGVPYGMASADLRYRWPAWRGLAPEISAEAAWVGHSYLTFSGGRANLMGGYGTARAQASLVGEGWRGELYVNNLTDEVGNTFAFGNPFSRSLKTQSTPLRPRTYGVRLRREF